MPNVEIYAQQIKFKSFEPSGLGWLIANKPEKGHPKKTAFSHLGWPKNIFIPRNVQKIVP